MSISYIFAFIIIPLIFATLAIVSGILINRYNRP